MSAGADRRGLTDWLRPERKPRVLVVGDMILDRYQYGSTTRISPEAPIPVLAASHEEDRLGGCGNVAANIASLGAEVHCIAVVGRDEGAARVRELLGVVGVDASELVADGERPTIRKTRLVSQSQQLLRIDEERIGPLAVAVEQALLDHVAVHLPEVDVVVISDYGKGTLTDAVLERICRQRGADGPRVLVDPKGKDYTRYRGASLLTPNKLEAETATGVSIEHEGDVRRAAEVLCAQADLEAAVITLGAKGMYCRTADGSGEWSIPAQARAVYDVTGAGDTVIATLAHALGAGAPLYDALRLANAAGGIAVQRFGVAAITPDELEAALVGSVHTSSKIVARDELVRRLAAERAAGRRIVFTNGCFDVLHVGHLDYLTEARSLGDVLVIGINDDASVTRLKGPPRPVNTMVDRAALLAGMECVSFVTHFDADTPLQLIEAITPDVLVKGEDWADKGVVGREWVEQHGGRVVLAQIREGHSTTRILQQLGIEDID